MQSFFLIFSSCVDLRRITLVKCIVFFRQKIDDFAENNEKIRYRYLYYDKISNLELNLRHFLNSNSANDVMELVKTNKSLFKALQHNKFGFGVHSIENSTLKPCTNS